MLQFPISEDSPNQPLLSSLQEFSHALNLYVEAYESYHFSTGM